MAGRNTRDRHANLIEGAPPAADPTGIFEAFVRRMENVSNNIGNHLNGNHGREAPIRQTGDRLLERFRTLHPEQFARTAESWKVEQWLQ